MEELTPNTRYEKFLSAAAGSGSAPDPVTREEKFLKAIADNAGGGSSLPSTETASAGDGLFLDDNKEPQWAAPSGGGGGVLVVTDTDGTLNKTWQEIHDGIPAVIIADDGDDRYAYCVQSATKAPDGTSFIVTVGSMADNTAYTDNYVASSASGYPVLNA